MTTLFNNHLLATSEACPDLLCSDKQGFFENSKWLNTKEAAEYFRTSPKQIRKWVYQGKIKAYKLFAKSLRFKKEELDLILEGGRVWQ